MMPRKLTKRRAASGLALIGLIFAGALLYRYLGPDPYAFILNTTPRSRPLLMSSATEPASLDFTVLPGEGHTYYAIEIDVDRTAGFEAGSYKDSGGLPVRVILKMVTQHGKLRVGPAGLGSNDCFPMAQLPSWAKEIPACSNRFLLTVSDEGAGRVTLRSAMFYLGPGQYDATVTFLADAPTSFGSRAVLAVRAKPKMKM